MDSETAVPERPPKPKPYRRKGVFDFLGLSREIRDMIYDELILILPASSFTGNFNRPGRNQVRKRVKGAEQSTGGGTAEDHSGPSQTVQNRQPKSQTPNQIQPVPENLQPPKPQSTSNKQAAPQYEVVQIPVVRTCRLRRHGLLYVNRQIHLEYAEVLHKHARPTFHISKDNINFKGKSLQPFWEISGTLTPTLRHCKLRILCTEEFEALFLNNGIAIRMQLKKFITKLSKLESIEVIVIKQPNPKKLIVRDFDRMFGTIFKFAKSISAFNAFTVKRHNSQWHIQKLEDGRWRVTQWYSCNRGCDFNCTQVHNRQCHLLSAHISNGNYLPTLHL